MATMTIEGIPEAIVARLARAAAGNGRCLNSEVIVHLARSAASSREETGRAGEPPGLRCGAGHGCRCRRSPAMGQDRVGWGGPAAGAAASAS